MTVLDASSVLAVVHQEPGADVVHRVLGQASISSVNLAEVLSKGVDLGVPLDGFRASIDAMELRVASVSPQDAVRSAMIRAIDAVEGRPVLSLADRLCLALAHRLGVPVLTADRAWVDLDVGVEVQLIR